MFRVYTASKLKHAAMWKAIHDSHPDIYFHARWLKHTLQLQTPDTPENAATFWLQDEADVVTSDAVFVYAAPDDHLRGALVEAGIGIAHGKPIYVIGKHPDFGTWQYHPLVTQVETIEEAIEHLAGRMKCDHF